MKRDRPFKMKFRLACGHTRKLAPQDDFMKAIHEPCMRCVQEARKLTSGS